MADKPRKVTLRFSDDEFEAIDDKRHSQRTSFQALGEQFFKGWLDEGKAAAPAASSTPSEPGLTRKDQEILQSIAEMMRAGDRRMRTISLQVEDWKFDQEEEARRQRESSRQAKPVDKPVGRKRA